MHLLLALALGLAVASAQSGPVLEFPPEARATQDGFFAGIVTTSNFERFAQAWIHNGEGLGSTITQHAVRGERLTTVVLFEDCRPAADGKCNVTGHYTYLTPDGAEYGSGDVDVWKRAPNRGGGVMVGLGPTLVVDPPDPMGRWTLRAEIRDNVRGATVRIQTPIIVDTPAAAAAN